MATYKYQQNLSAGASSGYVQYNITPDFGTVLAGGHEGTIFDPYETFTITGKIYAGVFKCYGLIAELAATSEPGAFGFQIGRIETTISKGGSATFSMTCEVTQEMIDYFGADERSFEAFPFFYLANSEDDYYDHTLSNANQKLTLLQYRLAPAINGVTFTDSTGAYDHFGGAVLGKSDLTAVLDITLDPLDTSVTLCNATLSTNTWQITADESDISGGSVHFGVLGAADGVVAGTAQEFQIHALDSKGKSGNYVGGAFTVYAYESPRLEALAGVDLAERYEVILNDDGSESTQLSDAGSYLWTSFAAEISAINGKNAWTIKRAYAESGYELPTGETVLSAADGEALSRTRDQTIFPRTLVFSANKRYTVALTLTDYFETQTLTFDVDKAGGYFNIEKNGVAVGMRSTGTAAKPLFESAYAGRFYAGIDGVNNYSTAETDTGGTWIDGKKIYRKVISLNAEKASTWYVTEGENAITDAETIVGYSLLAAGASYISNGTMFYSTSVFARAYMQSIAGTQNAYQLVYWTNTDAALGKVHAIVDYTKLTDSGTGGGTDGNEPTETETVSRPAAAMTANSSANCVASASSEYSASYAAWRAFDGVTDSANGWASASSDSSKWIQLEMDTALKNIEITIVNRKRSSLVNGMKKGSIQCSNDGGTWETLCTISGRDGATSQGKTVHALNNETAYRFVRVRITSSSNDSYAAIGEIQIVGEIS